MKKNKNVILNILFKQRGFTACQIKDLSTPALALRRNGGREQCRFVGKAYRLPNFNSHTIGRLAFAKCTALSSSFAFTLAEVLITLAIIGVVAALTIPTVVRNYQKQETVTRLKKAYSSLANASNLAVAEYGPINSWDFGTVNFDYDEEWKFTNYFLPYLKIQKKSTAKTPASANVSVLNRHYPNYSANVNTYLQPRNHPNFLLTDGTLMWVFLVNTASNPLGGVAIDINGDKKPNRVGQDTFFAIFSKNNDSFGKPAVKNKDRSTLITECKEMINVDFACTELIMRDGWQIRDDYPWVN